MQSHGAEDDEIRRLQQAEAEPEASANYDSASGGFLWIVGNKQDDFKKKHVMQKVRQTAMGSYLQGARSQASNKSRSNSEASDKSQSSVSDQGATKTRPTKTPKGKGKTDSEKKGLVPNKQVRPNSNVQGTSDPGSQIARQSTLPRRPIVVPIMEQMRGHYPFDLCPVPELYSLGKGLDPFGTMFQSRDARVNVEGLKFQCASYFGTEGLGKYWIPLCLSYPHAFLSTLYMASAFKDVIENSRVESLETAALRQDVIHFVSEHLTNREQCVADHNIIAVSQLILGNVITRMDAGLTFHQNGIETMIKQRGGLSKLGVHGQLASAVSWANLAIAILREKEPTQMYVEYCTIHSAKKYARDIVIPESPLYRPHDRYVTLEHATKCTRRAQKLLDEVYAMIELFLETQRSNRQGNASKLRNYYNSINQYPPGSKGDGWRYEAIRLTARVQAQAIIDQVPLSEALKRVQSSETQPAMYSSSIASRSNDSISSTLEFQQVTPATKSSKSPNFAPYSGIHPHQQVGFPFNHRDSTSSTHSQRPSPLSIQSSSSAISPQLWITTSTSGRSTILQQLRDALEKSDLSECWSDMAGVLLWIGLVMGAASNENEDKLLARYFSATTMRACIMLCFEHPEAVHSTMLKMTYLRGARSQSDAAGPVGKESSMQKLTRKGSAKQSLSLGVEQRSGAHGIGDDSQELKDQKGHSTSLRNNLLKSSTDSKQPSYSGLSTSAQANLLEFILQFVKKMYNTYLDQFWDNRFRVSRSAASIEKHFGLALEFYVTQLMTVSKAALNASPNANEQDATLTTDRTTTRWRKKFLGAVLIHHYRVPIARLFSVWEPGLPASAIEVLKGSLQQMHPPDFSPERHGLKANPVIEFEKNWGGYRSMAGKVASSYNYVIELSQYLDTTITDAELRGIVDILVSTDEMRFLALRLRYCLSQEHCSAMQLIDATISAEKLYNSYRGRFVAEIEVHWSITNFMHNQYGDQYGVDIPQFGSVVTLTGSSAQRAQASTCADYIMSTWPLTGPFFLELLDAIHAAVFAADTKRRVQVSSRAHTGFTVWADVDCISNREMLTVFEVYAMDQDLLVQAAQLLSWLSSAFTISPFKDQLAFSTPLFARTRRGVFFISIKHELVNEIEQICWLNLFNGACIVAGFPIPDRADEIGLEISLELLAGLSGARHVFEYEGGLVMKGFSHMFVPVRRQLDRVQWHAVSSLDGETPLSYNDGILRCTSRAMLDEVSLQDLASLRVIVGWCSKATTCLGSSHADYENIDYTKAHEAHSGLRCTGGSLGFQQFGVAALDVKFGLKDGKSHFQRSGPYQKIIRFAEGSPIVLHDVENKQSWLVPATNVMLHIVQHRHRLDPFQEDGKPISLDTDIVTGSSAKQVLLENRNRVLFEDDKHTFMDEILDIWSLLEFLLAQNVTRQRETPGVRIPSSVHESLYGFEFKAIVHQDALYKLKKTDISRNHGGWSKLIEDIDALVLFANGFGDVILPAGASDQDLCRKWRRVPHGQDYLATTTNMLETLFDKAGSRVDRKYLTTKSKLRWHQGSSALFNECQDVTTCDCTRVQQLLPESAIKSAQPPTSIADEGAVIFGHPEPRSTPLRSTISKISSSLYSQPNIPILPRIVRRRSSTNDERKGKVRRLDIEAEEIGCEHNHRPQAMS